jgi:hypothetical protein
MAALQYPSSKKSRPLIGVLAATTKVQWLYAWLEKYVHQTSEPASATNDVSFHLLALAGFNFLQWQDYPR